MPVQVATIKRRPATIRPLDPVGHDHVGVQERVTRTAGAMVEPNRQQAVARRRAPPGSPAPRWSPGGARPARRRRPWRRPGRTAATRSWLAATPRRRPADRKSTRLNSSHITISYAVFCLKKKKKQNKLTSIRKKHNNYLE